MKFQGGAPGGNAHGDRLATVDEMGFSKSDSAFIGYLPYSYSGVQANSHSLSLKENVANLPENQQAPAKVKYILPPHITQTLDTISSQLKMINSYELTTYLLSWLPLFILD